MVFTVDFISKGTPQWGKEYLTRESFIGLLWVFLLLKAGVGEIIHTRIWIFVTNKRALQNVLSLEFSFSCFTLSLFFMSLEIYASPVGSNQLNKLMMAYCLAYY